MVSSSFTKLDLHKSVALMQARLPEIAELTSQLSAANEELSNIRFALEEDRATTSAAQV